MIHAVARPSGRAPGQDRRAAKLARALEENKQLAAHALLRSVAGWDKYAGDIAACGGDPGEFIEREISVFVDYLRLYFETGDVTYKHLYIGEKRKQLHPDQWSAEHEERKRQIVAADTLSLLNLFSEKLGDEEVALLREELEDIRRVVLARGDRSVDILFVEDCLYLDILSFLPSALLEEGISIHASPLSLKNVGELNRTIQSLSDRKFDLIFFSPFTYECSPEYSQLMDWKRVLAGADVEQIVKASTETAAGIIQLLARTFDCPIFVHNSANIRRHDGSVAERVKNLITRPARRKASRLVNRRIGELVEACNLETFQHLFVLDEAELLKTRREEDLGRYFYRSALQHPAVFGQQIASLYRDVITVTSTLLKKKLVICDLDNTLWKGIIGEGPVEHHRERQSILQRLREKGVLLAVSSKNDPRMVRYTGGVLGESDFVASEISWDPKASGIHRIRKKLNLKPEHFVFIDDRADERALVKMSFPELDVLDAEDERSWKLLDLWARMLPDQQEGDRTRLYHEREQREVFLEEESNKIDQAEVLRKLELNVSIREVQKADHGRVVELINRTNQFNLAGSRTSMREMSGWSQSGSRRVFVAEASDRFGSSGIVCVMALELGPGRVGIPLFVLSCRVFGYGIETVMLNVAKRLAASSGSQVAGSYRETANNEPCRDFYPRHGFTRDGTEWVCKEVAASPEPTWLAVRSVAVR